MTQLTEFGKKTYDKVIRSLGGSIIQCDVFVPLILVSECVYDFIQSTPLEDLSFDRCMAEALEKGGIEIKYHRRPHLKSPEYRCLQNYIVILFQESHHAQALMVNTTEEMIARHQYIASEAISHNDLEDLLNYYNVVRLLLHLVQNEATHHRRRMLEIGVQCSEGAHVKRVMGGGAKLLTRIRDQIIIEEGNVEVQRRPRRLDGMSDTASNNSSYEGLMIGGGSIGGSHGGSITGRSSGVAPGQQSPTNISYSSSSSSSYSISSHSNQDQHDSPFSNDSTSTLTSDVFSSFHTTPEQQHAEQQYLQQQYLQQQHFYDQEICATADTTEANSWIPIAAEDGNIYLYNLETGMAILQQGPVQIFSGEEYDCRQDVAFSDQNLQYGGGGGEGTSPHSDDTEETTSRDTYGTW